MISITEQLHVACITLISGLLMLIQMIFKNPIFPIYNYKLNGIVLSQITKQSPATVSYLSGKKKNEITWASGEESHVAVLTSPVASIKGSDIYL